MRPIDRRLTPLLRLGAVLLLGAAVATAVLDDGGFNPGPRELFGVLAGAAMLLTAGVDHTRLLAAARQPTALVLWLLAGFGAASALWTVATADEALRWALAPAGYGAVAVCAATLARPARGADLIAALIGALAVTACVIGVVAAVRQLGPNAEYSAGYWRPAGPFEYAPTLGLLAVSALPVLLSGMCRMRPVFAALTAAAAAICVVTLALDHSRTDSALAVCVCLVGIIWPERTVGAGRAIVLAAGGVLVTTAGVAYVIAGRPIGPVAVPAPVDHGLLLAATVATATAIWMLGREFLRMKTRNRAPDANLGTKVIGICFALAAIAGCVVALAVASGVEHSGTIPQPGNGGFSHGRLRLWASALHVAERRSFYGFGADSFLSTTFTAQDRFQPPVRYAHDLPVELAVELGAPGLLLALVLCAVSAKALWRRRDIPRVWQLGPAAAAWLVSNLLDWTWHLAGAGAVWALALGGLLAVPSQRRRGPGSSLEESGGGPEGNELRLVEDK